MSNIFSQWRQMRGDVEPDALPDCPYCGQQLEPNMSGRIYCDVCDVEWTSLTDVAKSAAAVAALDKAAEGQS